MSSDLINFLLSFQPNTPELASSNREYDHQARKFVLELSNVSPQQLVRGADTPQDPLEICNPAVNTIAYLFVLLARIGDSKTPKAIPEQLRPGGTLWNKIVLFLETADPVQLRYVGKEWRDLLSHVEQVARMIGTPALAISPIRSGMLRLDPITGTFTTVHLQFIQLCVETRSYSAANPIIDNYIHSLPSSIPQLVRDSVDCALPVASNIMNSGEYIHLKSGHSDKVTLQDLQEYYVLAALAYIGQKQWKKAKECLEYVLVTPVHGTHGNGLMLEAYKKWALVSCLKDGSVKSLPRTVNPSAIKGIKSASKAYDSLAEAFSQLNNLPKLRAQINAGKETWAEDGNAGLVNELTESQYRFYVSRLSRTFSAIPVSKIAAVLDGSVEELTVYLEKLIGEGHLNARIERTDRPELGVVLRFFQDPTQGPLARTEKQQFQALLEQTERTNQVAEHVKSADYRLSLTKEYVEYIKRQNNKKASQGGDAMEMQFDDTMDEDLMQ